MFYPLFGKEVRHNEMKLYRIIDKVVEMNISDMGGASFRGSRDDTIKILERQGYDGNIALGYVEEYERRTMEEYYESTKKES